MARCAFRSRAVPSVVVLVVGLAGLGWFPGGANASLPSPTIARAAANQVQGATPEPVTANVYTSPQYGYTVTFGEEWFVTDESSDRDGDLVTLSDLRSTVLIIGDAESAIEGITASVCAALFAFGLAAELGAVRVDPLIGQDGAPVRGQEPGRAFIAHTYTPAAGDDTTLVVWVDCRLAPDRSVALITIALVNGANYAEELPLLQQLFAGIVMPQPGAAAPGPAGTPQAGYTATDLGTLGGESSWAGGIDDDGKVVAFSQTADWWVLHPALGTRAISSLCAGGSACDPAEPDARPSARSDCEGAASASPRLPLRFAPSAQPAEHAK